METSSLHDDLKLLETADLIELLDMLGYNPGNVSDDVMRNLIEKRFYDLDYIDQLRLDDLKRSSYTKKKRRTEELQKINIDPESPISLFSNIKKGQLQELLTMDKVVEFIRRAIDKKENRDVIDNLFNVLISRKARENMGMNVDESKFINFDVLQKLYVPGARESWVKFFDTKGKYVKELLKNIDYVVAQNQVGEVVPFFRGTQTTLLSESFVKHIVNRLHPSVLVTATQNLTFPPEWIPYVLNAYLRQPYKTENIVRVPDNRTFFKALLEHLNYPKESIRTIIDRKYLEKLWNQKFLVTMDEYRNFLSEREKIKEKKREEQKREEARKEEVKKEEDEERKLQKLLISATSVRDASDK